MKGLFTIILTLSVASLHAQPNHNSFDALLREYVNLEGAVNYKELSLVSTKLDNYINELAQKRPADSWSDSEELTYWINAYNALTLQLVLKYYPIESIKDIGSVIQIPFVNTPWDIKVFESGGKNYSLNDIEHSIIRKKFNEPRIHFALVCAAVACPKLRNEAYDTNRLDEQLTNQTRSFLANKSKNEIGEDYLKLSKLFSWYGSDFRKQGNMNQFINKYTDTNVSKKAKTSFLVYNWSLNEQ